MNNQLISRSAINGNCKGILIKKKKKTENCRAIADLSEKKFLEAVLSETTSSSQKEAASGPLLTVARHLLAALVTGAADSFDGMSCHSLQK